MVLLAVIGISVPLYPSYQEGVAIISKVLTDGKPPLTPPWKGGYDN
mgnify:CR=1 FL=1